MKETSKHSSRNSHCRKASCQPEGHVPVQALGPTEVHCRQKVGAGSKGDPSPYKFAAEAVWRGCISRLFFWRGRHPQCLQLQVVAQQ